ncbi:MAG TPA: PilN domain-containing protein [Acidobacteriaceae bacterium]|jgi:type IV pilus assembly protein PilN
MRISINLASRPFVELRPLFLRLRILMGVLAAVALALGIWAHVLQKKLDHAAGQMDALRNQTIAAQQERLHNEARMRQPTNAAVLDRAHFLNALFLEKSFSWTAVMMDLENVLPTGVQVTSIEPQATSSGDLIIRMRVSGERDRAVQLVRNLEHSRRFLQPRLSGEASQAKTSGANAGSFRQPQMNVPTAPPGVEFDILANYNPLPEGESYTKPETTKSPVTKHTSKTRGGAR